MINGTLPAWNAKNSHIRNTAVATHINVTLVFLNLNKLLVLLEFCIKYTSSTIFRLFSILLYNSFFCVSISANRYYIKISLKRYNTKSCNVLKRRSYMLSFRKYRLFLSSPPLLHSTPQVFIQLSEMLVFFLNANFFPFCFPFLLQPELIIQFFEQSFFHPLQ